MNTPVRDLGLTAKPVRPPMRLSLMSKGGQCRIRLSDPHNYRGEGIFLRSVPKGLWMENRTHQRTQSAGQLGETWLGQVRSSTQFDLDLIVKGDRADFWVDQLMTLLGDGADHFLIVAWHPRLGWHWLPVHLDALSEVDYLLRHPHVDGSAKIKLVVSADAPVWRRFSTNYTYRREQLSGGFINFHVDGTEPIWPRFQVVGQWESLKMRLHRTDPWIEIPHHREGWVFDTSPHHRVVQTGDGSTDFMGFIPHWPHPIQPTPTSTLLRTGTAFIEVEGAGDDFELSMSFTPLRSRAW